MKIRILLVGALVAAGIGLTGAAASAKPQVGGCGTGFGEPLSIAEIIEAFPPPPDFPDPEGALRAFDVNGDDHLCVKPQPQGRIIVVDNRSPGQLT
jgi:hypothetical protein